MKLTATQREVLQRMAAGWEMGVSTGLRGRSWLQRDGIGRGGQTEEVHGNTFFALTTRKLIEQVGREFPTSRYRLTPLGRELANEKAPPKWRGGNTGLTRSRESWNSKQGRNWMQR